MGVSMDDRAMLEELRAARERIEGEIAKVVVGQRAIIENLLIALIARGHGLLIGVPGLAKTLLISTLARVLDLSFGRIQFTPDLMPSDITGTEVLEEDQATGRKGFRFVKGPVFNHIVLADEINRTPPKTQAALLQAMQEREVTVAGQTNPLSEPFFVLATQNPIEQEGTYPLPEAQLDRFMLNLWIDYPSEAEEVRIAELTFQEECIDLERVLDAERLIAFQHFVRTRIVIERSVVEYAVALARDTRPSRDGDEGYINELVRWGTGPRASQYLVLAAKARAALHGHPNVAIEDVHAVARAVLRHRIVLSFHAEAEGVDAVDVVDRVLAERPAPGPRSNAVAS